MIGSNSSFFLPRTYSFTDDGVTVKFSNSERKARWSTFVDWKRMANYYVLYLANSSAIVIPESAIPGGELAVFENLLNQNIKSKKSTRR